MHLTEPYLKEKENFREILENTNLYEFSYNEKFILTFYRNILKESWLPMWSILIIDTECWFGEKMEWEIRRERENLKSATIISEDSMFASELVDIKYHGYNTVENIKFEDESLKIIFTNDNSMSISYYSETDYSWILEEYGNKKEEDRMVILCQNCELYSKNIPRNEFFTESSIK